MQNRLRINPKFTKVATVFLGVIALYFGMIVVLRMLGLDTVKDSIHSLGIWSPIAFVLICILSNVFAPLSGSSIFVTGGLVFGRHSGFLLSLFAAVLGCCINFWIARRFGRKVASRLIGKGSLQKLDRFTARLNSHHSILMMIVIMLLAQDLVSYAIGLTKVKFPYFFIALVISGAAIVGTYVYLGSEVIERLL